MGSRRHVRGVMAGATRTPETDASVEALRRWLEGQDAALDAWLRAPVRPVRRRQRALAGP